MQTQFIGETRLEKIVRQTKSVSFIAASARVALGPLASGLLKLRGVLIVLGADRRDQRALPVRVFHEAVDELDGVLECVGRVPVALELLEADRAILVDVRVVDFRVKLDRWWGRRVLSWDRHREEENSILIRGARRRREGNAQFADIVFLWIDCELEIFVLAVGKELALDYLIHCECYGWPDNSIKKW